MVSIAPPGCLHELEADENIKKGATKQYHLVHAHFHVFHKILYTRASTLVLFLQETTMERTAEEKTSKSVGFARKRAPTIPTISIKRTFLCISLSTEIETCIGTRLNDSISAHQREKANGKGRQKKCCWIFMCSFTVFARKRAPPGIILDERWLWELRETD
jgi:hypothetical protein